MNPRHTQYEERMEWVGNEFDPKAFHLEEVNQALRELELEAAGATRCLQHAEFLENS